MPSNAPWTTWIALVVTNNESVRHRKRNEKLINSKPFKSDNHLGVSEILLSLHPDK